MSEARDIVAEEQQWAEGMARPGQRKTQEVRLRRVHNAEQYLNLFEKSHAQSTLRRLLFRFFCGLVAYAQIGGCLILFTFALSTGFCRKYIAVVPLVGLMLETFVLSVMCLVISIRLACRAEIFQVWRQVLTTNVAAVFASLIGLVAFSVLYKDAQEDKVTAWVVVPVFFILIFHLTLHILIKDDDISTSLVQIVVTMSLILIVLFYVLHATTGVPMVSAFFPLPLCLFFLIGLGFRNLALSFLRNEFTWLEVIREVSSLLAYGVLLLPSLELVINCSRAGTAVCGGEQISALSWSSATITVPLGIGLLAPTWAYAMGGWAENVAFGFLAL